MPELEILSPDRVDRMVTRLAYEVVERNRGTSNLVLLGIMRRGEAVANMLAEEISQIGEAVTAVPIDVSAFRDDVERDSEARSSLPGIDLTGRDVVLVDDVLFTGRTVRAALDAIVEMGRPLSIQLVVLVDRGHREYPIQADFVGRTIPTKHRERVEVRIGSETAVYVVES